MVDAHHVQHERGASLANAICDTHPNTKAYQFRISVDKVPGLSALTLLTSVILIHL